MKKWRRFLSILLACFLCISVIQVYAEEETSEARLEKAKELGLEKWVGEDGFLVDEFYADKSDKELEEMHVHELVNSMTPEELDAFVNCLNAGIMVYSVTYYKKIQEGYDITGVFEVNGVLAFCIQHSVITPPVGSPTSTPVESKNENLRKVLYYGYNGPASKGYSYVETAMAASEANGDPAGNKGKRVLAEISVLPSPPSNFKVWVVHTNGGASQDLAYYTFEKNGYAKVKKISSNVELTDSNNCYSLQGAVYGLYSDSTCKIQVAKVTTKANGESDEVELAQGTYYAKEITAPKGYALSQEVKEVPVLINQTTVFTMSEIPQTAPLEIVLEKIDAETKEQKPQGSATLQDAQFIVKFYKGHYEENIDPASENKTPEKEWTFKTDENGVVKFCEEYKIAGDEFWLDSEENPVLPLGTVTIQEIKAPEGYHLNSEIFVRKITSEGTKASVQTFQKAVVEENVLKLNLVKLQAGTNFVIPEAEFEHMKPDGTKEVVKTDENGELTLKGLQHGVHQIKEISVMDGYVVNQNILEFVVSENNEITLQSMLDESLGKIEFQVSEDGNIVVEMEDLLAPYSLLIHKINNKDLKLSGAEFTLYSDEACSEVVKKGITDTNGLLRFEELQVGKKYYLQETKAPEGYRIPTDLFGNPIVYEIYTESTPTEDQFEFYVNGKVYGLDEEEMFFQSGTKANREVNAIIVNKIGFKLPDTGSNWMIPIVSSGGILCAMAYSCSKKRKYEKGEK